MAKALVTKIPCFSFWVPLTSTGSPAGLLYLSIYKSYFEAQFARGVYFVTKTKNTVLSRPTDCTSTPICHFFFLSNSAYNRVPDPAGVDRLGGGRRRRRRRRCSSCRRSGLPGAARGAGTPHRSACQGRRAQGDLPVSPGRSWWHARGKRKVRPTRGVG